MSCADGFLTDVGSELRSARGHTVLDRDGESGYAPATIIGVGGDFELVAFPGDRDQRREAVGTRAADYVRVSVPGAGHTAKQVAVAAAGREAARCPRIVARNLRRC